MSSPEYGFADIRRAIDERGVCIRCGSDPLTCDAKDGCCPECKHVSERQWDAMVDRMGDAEERAGRLRADLRLLVNADWRLPWGNFTTEELAGCAAQQIRDIKGRING